MPSNNPIVNSLFISDLLSDLERRILAAADVALIGRDLATVERVAKSGLGFLSLFALAVSLNQSGDRGRAESLARELADQAPDLFRSRALVLLASNCWPEDPDEALFLYEQAGRRAYDPVTAITILKMKAVVFSCAFGNHSRALQHLEKAVPLLGSLTRVPSCRDEFFNALAVEFMHAGRLGQALELSRLATRSPWARNFPEWSATARSISESINVAPSSAEKRPAKILRFPSMRAETEIAVARLDAIHAVTRITDKPLLQSITALPGLSAAHRDLVVRATKLNRAGAQSFADMADHLMSKETPVRQKGQRK